MFEWILEFYHPRLFHWEISNSIRSYSFTLASRLSSRYKRGQIPQSFFFQTTSPRTVPPITKEPVWVLFTFELQSMTFIGELIRLKISNIFWQAMRSVISTLFLLYLARGALSCLVVDGQVSDGLTTQFEVTTTDNGVKTCSFTCSGQTSDCDGDCISGYSAKFHTNGKDGATLEYTTPHGSYTVDVPTESTSCLNCCGGTIPCSCCQFQYGGSYFGC